MKKLIILLALSACVPSCLEAVMQCEGELLCKKNYDCCPVDEIYNCHNKCYKDSTEAWNNCGVSGYTVETCKEE